MMQKTPKLQEEEQKKPPQATKITAVALAAIAATLIAALSIKSLLFSPQINEQKPLLILAEENEELALGEDDDELNVIQILSKQKKTQKKQIVALSEELEATKALMQQMRARLLVVDGSREEKLKKRAHALEEQIRESERVSTNYVKEISKRDRLLEEHRKEFDTIARILGETNNSVKQQLENILTLLNHEKERSESLELQLADSEKEGKERIEELKLEVKEATATVASLQESLTNAKEQLVAAESINLELQAQQVQLEEAFATKKDEEVAGLELSCLNLQEQIAALNETNRSLQEQMANAEELNQELELQLTALVAIQEAEPLPPPPDEAAEEKARVIEEMMATLEETNAKQLELIDLLTGQLQDSVELASLQNDEDRQSKENIASLQEEVFQYQKSLNEAKELLLSLSEQTAHIDNSKTSTLNDMTAMIKKLQEQNEQYASDNSTLREQIDEACRYKEQIALLTEQNIAFQEEIAHPRTDKSVIELEDELFTALDQYSSEKKKADRLQRELDTMTSLLNTIQEENLGLSASNGQNRYNASPTKLKAKIAQLTTRLAQEINKAHCAEEKLGAMESKYQDLARHNDEISHQLSYLKGEKGDGNVLGAASEDPRIKELKNELVHLEQELCYERESNRRAARQVELARVSHASQQEQRQDYIQMQEELRQHKIALASMQNEFNLLANEYADLEAQHHQVAKSYERHVAELNDLLAEEQTKNQTMINEIADTSFSN